MTEIGALVERLVEAGVPVGEASEVVALAFAAGASSAAIQKSPGAIRTARWRENQRHKTSQNVTDRHADEASQNITERHEASRSDVCDKVPKEYKYNKPSRANSDRPSRGTRIDPNWQPAPADRLAAREEGFSDTEIDRETLRFRDYWVGLPGAKGVKLDWPATWRNWVRRSAEGRGKSSSAKASTASSEASVSAEEAVKILARTGRWSRYAGPEPGHSGCRASPELLAKHGLMPDGRRMSA